MEKSTKIVGDQAENLAKTYLENKGYEFLKNNFRYKRNEIDLIMKTPDTLVFIEVKFRKTTQFGNPENFVDTGKISRIKKAAEVFIFQINWHGKIRFDVIAINQQQIEHFQDIY